MDIRNKDSPLVYICPPFSGDVEGNTQRARLYSRLAVEHGCIPLAPHLLFPQFISEATERETAIHFGLRLLKSCEELWICGGIVSTGMRNEIAQAEKLGMTIRNIKEEEIECMQLPKD